MSPERQATGSSKQAGTRPPACCPLYHEAVELIGRRWTGAIVAVLLDHGQMGGTVTARWYADGTAPHGVLVDAHESGELTYPSLSEAQLATLSDVPVDGSTEDARTLKAA